jgi:protocatechuate 3,4-dioxygenase beta subunit
MRSFYFIALLLVGNCLIAQTDTSSLFKEVSQKLIAGQASASDILTNKNYLALHPQTSFRELIKKHSPIGTLAITTPEEPGKKIKVIATIINKAGQPVSNALIYLYQTDSRGWYAANTPHVLQNEGDMRHARLFGYVKTDKNGRIELHTVKPSGYPQSDLPAHIHVHVWAEGYSNFVNEFLFDDDERLVGNIREQSIRNRFIISKPEKANGSFDQQFSYTIILEK